MIDCYNGFIGVILVIVNGGNGGYSYNWEDFGIGDMLMLDGLIVGIYILQVFDVFGCIVSDIVIIS